MGRSHLMRAVDAAWLHMERPTNPMTVTALLQLRGPPDRSRLHDLIRRDLLGRWPRFSQVVREPRLGVGPPHWVDVEVEPAAHLAWETLSSRPGEAALQAQVGALMGTPLPRDRPLWQFTVLEGLEGGRAAIVCRMHHAIADGIALAQVLLSLCTDPRGRPARPDPPTPGAAREQRRLLARIDALARRGVHAFESLANLLLRPRDAQTLLRRAPLTGTKRVAWSPPVPLDQVKALGRPHAATVNDVLLLALTGALRTYLLARGEGAADVRVLVPVYVRPLDAPLERDLGNHFSLIYLSLPTGEPNRGRRLEILQERIQRRKASEDVAVAYALLHGLGASPQGIEAVLADFFAARASAIVTNVPGPREPLSLAGTPIEQVMFWVPQAATVGLGLSILSYAGQVTIGVAADTARVEDPGALARAFHAELQELQPLPT